MTTTGVVVDDDIDVDNSVDDSKEKTVTLSRDLLILRDGTKTENALTSAAQAFLLFSSPVFPTFFDALVVSFMSCQRACAPRHDKCAVIRTRDDARRRLKREPENARRTKRINSLSRNTTYNFLSLYTC